MWRGFARAQSLEKVCWCYRIQRLHHGIIKCIAAYKLELTSYRVFNSRYIYFESVQIYGSMKSTLEKTLHREYCDNVKAAMISSYASAIWIHRIIVIVFSHFLLHSLRFLFITPLLPPATTRRAQLFFTSSVMMIQATLPLDESSYTSIDESSFTSIMIPL